MYYFNSKVRKKILDIPFSVWYTLCRKGEIAMTTTIVTSKGQIVIPSKIRRRLNIKKGTKLYIEEKGDELILKAVTPAYFERIAGVLSTKGKLSKALIEERGKDKEREA
jgi:AbrB family looped-hinge helix DNA binding protein